MRLTDLDPTFVWYEKAPDGAIYTHEVAEFGYAQGVMFLCPKCFVENGGEVGTHAVLCWSRSRGVPDDAKPGPGRWTLAGSGLHDLTLNGDPPGNARSVQLTAGCMWHGLVTDGEVT